VLATNDEERRKEEKKRRVAHLLNLESLA